MRFKGKVAWWFYAIIIGAALLLIPMIIFSAFIDRNIPALIMVLTLFSALEIFCIPITFHNFAELQTETLLIVFGFIKRAIPYSNIDTLRATNNPSSSLGASLDRIEIKCKDKTCTMISLIEKEQFFKEIKKHGPNITII